MKNTLGCVRRADEDFALIQPGDRVAVGVSGGKDSFLLLEALRLYQMFSHKHYDLCAITVDPGYGFDASPLAEYCARHGIPFHLTEGAVVETANSLAKPGKSPCSLCAKLRRGALHDAARKAGCSKVALGHHFDDVVETYMLSLFYEGRISCFSPVTYLDRADITLIRPLLYVPEHYVRSFAKRHELPIVHNPCPADGNTKRQEI